MNPVFQTIDFKSHYCQYGVLFFFSGKFILYNALRLRYQLDTMGAYSFINKSSDIFFYKPMIFTVHFKSDTYTRLTKQNKKYP